MALRHPLDGVGWLKLTGEESAVDLAIQRPYPWRSETQEVTEETLETSKVNPEEKPNPPLMGDPMKPPVGDQLGIVGLGRLLPTPPPWP
ncbi:MAG: hypothetical protein KDB53_18140 [Planctomycetes bacterium]|nr:hypothetical protein [Planctomycetota bacterium]